MPKAAKTSTCPDSFAARLRRSARTLFLHRSTSGLLDEVNGRIRQVTIPPTSDRVTLSSDVMADTVVFIPAWNEEANLPAVLDELAGPAPADRRPRRRRRLDGRARRRSRVTVVRPSSPSARTVGCAKGSPRATRMRPITGTRSRAASMPTVSIRSRSSRGSSPSSARARPTSRSARASRPATATRRSGTSRARAAASGPPCCDGRCAPRSAGRFTMRRAGCTRSTHARCPYSQSRTRAERRRSSHSSACARPGLHVAEVPVHMRERASGESKLRGRRAVELVVTVAGTLLVYGVWRRHRRARR